jgi:hypothetical protein
MESFESGEERGRAEHRAGGDGEIKGPGPFGSRALMVLKNFRDLSRVDPGPGFSRLSSWFQRLVRDQRRGPADDRGSTSFSSGWAASAIAAPAATGRPRLRQEVVGAARRSGLGALDLKGRSRTFGARAVDATPGGAVASAIDGSSSRAASFATAVVAIGPRPWRCTCAICGAKASRAMARQAQMFDRDGEADHDAFAERCEDDRHHFVSSSA